ELLRAADNFLLNETLDALHHFFVPRVLDRHLKYSQKVYWDLAVRFQGATEPARAPRPPPGASPAGQRAWYSRMRSARGSGMGMERMAAPSTNTTVKVPENEGVPSICVPSIRKVSEDRPSACTSTVTLN